MPTETTNFILHLSDTGEGKSLPLALEGLPAKNAAGETIHYQRVLVAPHGDWKNPGTGAPIDVNRRRAAEWVKNVAAAVAAGRKPWVTPKHLFDKEGNFVTPDARDTLGYVERMEDDESGVYAVVGLHGDESLKVAARNSRSVGITATDLRDAKGNTFEGETLHHLALVPNPALPIAASADAPAIPVYSFASAETAPSRNGDFMNKELAAKVRAKLGFGADVPDDQLADKLGEKALALSEDLEAGNAKIATLTTERDAKAKEVLALSAGSRKPDALNLGMFKENLNTKRNLVIQRGKITQAQAALVDKLLVDAQGSPTVLALSACGEDRLTGFAIWDLIDQIGNSGIKTHDGVTRAEPVKQPELALSADEKKDKDLKTAADQVVASVHSKYREPATATAK